MAELESGTRAIHGVWHLGEIEGACSEIDDSIIEATLCLDFLAQLTTGELRRAASDALVALRSIAAANHRLRTSGALAANDQRSGAIGGARPR